MKTRLLHATLVAFATLLVTRSAGALEIGDPAPDFSLIGVDDRTHTLAEYASAKVLVVIFTCNHCPTAQAYESRIKRIVVDYRNRGVALVGISPNDPGAVRLDELGYTDLGDSLEDMKKRARDSKFNFPYLFDGETQGVSRAYGAVATPHAFVFDADRKLRYQGRIDDSDVGEVKSHDLRNAIDALLVGKKVPVAKTKVFGCSVKWASKRPSAVAAIERWEKEDVGLKSIDAGGLRSLIANPGKKLRIINFWATWCAPCVAEFPGFVELHRMYRKRDCEIATVSLDEPQRRDRALVFLNRQHASMANYLATVTDRYELIETVDSTWAGPIPYTLVVEPGGAVIRRIQGQVDFEDLKREIVGFLGRTYGGRQSAPAVRRLLGGDKLDAFYTYLGGTSTRENASDPDGVFTYEKGVLRISGQHRGYLATRESFSNYRLVAEFRWGEKTWDGRGGPRDSGLFFHMSGSDKLFANAFECQYKEGRTGDLCLIGDDRSIRLGGRVHETGCIDRPGHPPKRPTLGFRADDDLERPRGQWNTIEIVCRGDRIRISVNGRLAHDGVDASPSSGRIYLQSFNAELFYRRLDLYPIAD